MIQSSVPLTLRCAETTPAYLPRPADPRWAEAQRVSEEINKCKVQDPQYTGALVYDNLIDSLIANMTSLAKEREHQPEPDNWTPPQRCVWRYGKKIPESRRWEIVHDTSVCSDVKAFAAIRQGQWFVLCPFPGCNGAQYASVTSRRFFCVDCMSRAVDGRWVEVVWPGDPNGVEAWLDRRPHNAKNWDPGEDEEDIMRQDAEHLARGSS